MSISSITMNLIIAVAVYIVIEIIKKIAGDNFSKFSYFVPIIAVVLGVAFGLLCFAVFPEYITANSYITAAVVGALSGGAAVCGNQTVKQTAKRLMEKWGVGTSDSSDSKQTTTTTTTTTATGGTASAGGTADKSFTNDTINT